MIQGSVLRGLLYATKNDGLHKRPAIIRLAKTIPGRIDFLRAVPPASALNEKIERVEV